MKSEKKAKAAGRIWTLDVVKSRCTIDGDCWIWSNCCNNRGYPQASIESRPQLVGRWVLNHIAKQTCRPKLTMKECAVPRCQNKLCVSPLCLQKISRSKILLEEYSSGARDKDLKWRQQAAIERGWAKLTHETVQQIRLLQGFKSAAELARAEGVCEATIRRIWNGTRWKTLSAASSVFAWRPS